MRHAVFGKRLSRDINSRKALLNNLANSLLLHGYLKTTQTKAKFAKVYVEKMVTLAKRNKLTSDRTLASHLTHEAFIKLTKVIAPGFNGRNGGYTRIIKLSPRKGDAAKMARLELLPWKKHASKGAQAKEAKEAKASKPRSKGHASASASNRTKTVSTAAARKSKTAAVKKSKK